ncbi:argininosuccinate lyase [Petroclostridium sp. X23]|uniref:argininosuccinate lyase n=1 Tax=Petroclostridium sp. X23 TaxID=3045146 RepID=UPI0024AE5E46|nr:argininosuccinate lyase [Petroclostridium sp. X23]WHH60924.1 argininosuccinate lyase [Petroclostridium sp. X23]
MKLFRRRQNMFEISNEGHDKVKTHTATEGNMPFTVARLGKPMDDVLLDNMMRPRLNRERQSLYAFLYVDMSHTVMIAEQGIITPLHAKKILMLFREMQALGDDFPINPKFDGMVLQFERYLISKLGEEIGGRMHTGRSRPGHANAVNRVIFRDKLLKIHENLLELVDTIRTIAPRYAETIMPGYTHGQHAQPWTFAHYLMRWAYMFERDLERIEGSFSRVNRSALEGVALAGTSWPLNRSRTCELLGHDGLVLNSHDAATQCADYNEENAAVLAMLMNHIGRLASDMYLWSSKEFGMVKIADEYCEYSDVLPQQRNPHALERLKGMTSLAHGWVPGILGVLRPTATTDVDMSYGGDGNHTMWSSTSLAIELMKGIIETLTLNEPLMRERADIYWTTSSHLSDVISKEAKISFRTAHQVIARVVKLGLERNIKPQEVTTELMDEVALQTIGYELHVPQEVITRAMSAKEFLATRVTPGSPNPVHLPAQLSEIDEWLSERRKWQEGKKYQLANALKKLNDAVDYYISLSGGDEE